MGANDDLVIGAVAGYGWEDVEVWARSLVASGFQGTGAVIVYGRDRRGDRVADNLESLGLHAVRMPLWGSVYNRRFADISRVLREFDSRLRFAVVTDVRDVYFQADPIAWLESDLKRPFLAVSEGVRYADEKWNRQNLRLGFPAHAARLMSKVVHNVGVLAGDAAMLADLCSAISLTAESSGRTVADQSGYNLLLDMEPYRSAVQSATAEDGFACQAGTMAAPGPVPALRPYLVEMEPVFDGEAVRTAGGRLYSIVHQYDRVPEWKQAIRHKVLSSPMDGPSSPRGNDSRVDSEPGPFRTASASVPRMAYRLGVPRRNSSVRLYSPPAVPTAPVTDGPSPQVSIVCPTSRRPEFLCRVVRHYCAQTFDGGLELIIVDDNPEPADFLDERLCRDKGIRYYHMPNKRLSVGAKLELMSQLARGEIIVDFDDDDYYAPRYVERMVAFLGDADFVALRGWFAFDPVSKVFCYGATDAPAPTHFVTSARESFPPVSTRGGDAEGVPGNLVGSGFSFVWRKSVHAEVKIHADPPDGAEWDNDFAARLQQAGRKMVSVSDTEGLVLHVLHSRSPARMFPRYVLPDLLLPKFFPAYTENEP